MDEAFTPDSIASYIRMLRDSLQGTIVIVEGETDLALFRRLLHPDCTFITAFNKGNALEIMRILDSGPWEGVIAIVDTDFWALDGVESPSQNIVLTDSHDIETMMINSPALDRVLDEFGSASKVSAFVSLTGQSIREALLERGAPVGYLRWISFREGYNLVFDGLVFKNFINRKSEVLLVDENMLIRILVSRSQVPGVNDNLIQQHLTKMRNDVHDLWHVCCGHDLVHILSLLLRKAIGTRSTREVEPESLERNLRIAYESSFFPSTKLFGLIQRWEQETGYRVI